MLWPFESRPSPAAFRRVLVLSMLAAASTPLEAQTVDDGIMMSAGSLCAGFSYGHDEWSEYWEGTLKRDNQNVGTLTTQSVAFMANYGISDRFNVIAALPYVKTKASGGTLSPQKGVQDLTLAVKGRVFDAGLGSGTLRTMAVASLGAPVGDYVADLFPLSLGTQSTRGAGRLTLHYRLPAGLFADATGAYTWRGNVTLDRPAYFTNGQQFLTDQVDMPNVFDYSLRTGFMRGNWIVPVSFTQQSTRGGGDIRRQDMPFVSNRMNFSKLDGMVMYTFKSPVTLSLHVQASRVLSGRNVGQSTTLSAGISYLVAFSDKQQQLRVQ
jgi:hypothetical protein